MNKKIVLIIVTLFIFTSLFAQKREDLDKYRRSSLYSIVLSMPQLKYSAEIDSVFFIMPMPDKYENHNLSVRMITKQSKRASIEEMQAFFYENAVARRMVSKWFDRNDIGTFDVDLIAKRGFYNASDLDVEAAMATKRGMALLSDAGQELIQNSFIIVNEISYIDKEANAQIAKSILGTLATFAAVTAVAASGADNKNVSSIAAVTSVGLILGAAISDVIAGFTVRVNSHLFKLDWNDSVAAVFYQDYWCDKNSPPELIAQRKAAYDSCMGLFTLSYVGSYQAKSQETVLRGLYSNYDVIRKVCTRALDNNVAQLQNKFEVFRLKTPIYSVDDKYITSKVGLKEGIKPNSKFEVLQAHETEDGKTFYKRVGIVKPVKNDIWDNRYMAHLEEAEDSDLNGTKFKKISKVQLFPGMLIRQIK